MTYRVTAPYVTLTISGLTGPELHGFYKDALVADALDAEQVERLLRKRMIEELDEPKAEPKAPAKSAKAPAAE